MKAMVYSKKIVAFLLLIALPACAAFGPSFPRLENYQAGMDAAGKRFLVHAKIDGKPVTLALDTGNGEGLLLFKPAAQRLGLDLTGVPSDATRQNGKFFALETAPHDVTIFNTTGKLPLMVADFSVPMDVDGCAGWALFKNGIFQIDAAAGVIKGLPRVPRESRDWTKLRVRRNSDVLCLEMPGPRKKGIILVDTGDAGGVSLSPLRWQTWTNTHPERAKTLKAYYMGGSGVVVGEESWADTFGLGPIELNDVPIEPASPSDMAVGSPEAPYQATLGLTALQRMDLIIDGKSGVAYVRPRTGPFPPYSYNRASAVFVPRHPGRDKRSDLVAHVLEGGPAYQAGVRDGDIVISFDGQSPGAWHEGPTTASSTRPAGTKLKLTLKRGE